jgi:hypothetical protein
MGGTLFDEIPLVRKFFDGFASEAIDFADGEDDGAFQLKIKLVEMERGAAQSFQLGTESGGIEWLAFSGGEG